MGCTVLDGYFCIKKNCIYDKSRCTANARDKIAVEVLVDPGDQNGVRAYANINIFDQDDNTLQFNSDFITLQGTSTFWVDVGKLSQGTYRLYDVAIADTNGNVIGYKLF